MEVNGDDGEPVGKSPAEEEMTTFSRHHFGSSEDTADGFSVTIIEVFPLFYISLISQLYYIQFQKRAKQEGKTQHS